MQPWDWAYYAARDKAATYDVDTARVTPLLRARPGAARRHLLRRRPSSTASPSSSARTCRSTPTACTSTRSSTATAATLGLFVCDWFARPTKQGGAWMDEFVGQSHLLGHPAGRGGLPQRAAAAGRASRP